LTHLTKLNSSISWVYFSCKNLFIFMDFLKTLIEFRQDPLLSGFPCRCERLVSITLQNPTAHATVPIKVKTIIYLSIYLSIIYLSVYLLIIFPFFTRACVDYLLCQALCCAQRYIDQ
jgi:hypothetical protein